MKALVVVAMVIVGATASDLNAQRGGARGGAIARPGGAPVNRPGNWRGYGGYGWGYSGFYPDYGWPATYGDEIQTPQNVVLLMPVQQPPEPPPPPPEPARPVMHEYTWPAGGRDPHATFSIASRNGPVQHAVAVWVQGNEVRYTSADGSTGSMPPAAIDCGATERLNAQNQLRLSLPGCGYSR